MKEILIRTYRFSLKYAYELVADLDDTMMSKSPGKGFENHPAFTLGHLVTAAALTVKYLGVPYELRPDWEDLFRRKGPGDPKLPDSNSIFIQKTKI